MEFVQSTRVKECNKFLMRICKTIADIMKMRTSDLLYRGKNKCDIRTAFLSD